MTFFPLILSNLLIALLACLFGGTMAVLEGFFALCHFGIEQLLRSKQLMSQPISSWAIWKERDHGDL